MLGFSLLFRERKALLALARRGLAPGVRVRDYEAEIPNVAFPLKGALQATRFRHRRCRAVQATLVVERRAIEPWLESRLLGQNVAGFVVDEIEVDLRADLPGARTPRPVLGLGGRGPDGGTIWWQVALTIEPDGRHLRLRPSHRWLFGDTEIDADQVWRALLPRVRDVITAQPDGSVLVDVARLSLTGPFVRTGWKAPDLDALGIETVALGRRSISVELRVQDGGPPEPVESSPPDPVGDILARVHAHRGDLGALDDVLATLDELSRLLESCPRARLACVQWAVQTSRYHDRAACLGALRQWLDLRPTALPARRLLAVTLARAGLDDELVRLLVAARRETSDSSRALRLDLALAATLVDRLDEPRSALALLRPVVTRLRDAPPGDPERQHLPQALVILAQARVADAAAVGARASHAQQALDEALELVPPELRIRRADMRAAVARTFARHGETGAALVLLTQALAEDPDNDEHLDLAIDASLRLGEREAAVDMLRHRLGTATANERPELRRRLLGVLAELDDPAYLALTREEVERALDLDPDAADVLRLAADIERQAGQLAHAADHLARLSELERDPTAQAELEVERAQLLVKARLPDSAWEAARHALRLLDALRDDPEAPSRLRSTLALALELAPPTARTELLDRFIEVASGEALAKALVERADTQIRHADKIEDLTRAARALDQPAPLLARIEQLVGDDPRGLADLIELAESREVWPVCASALARLGRLAARDGRHEHAKRLLSRAIELTNEPGLRAGLRASLADSLEALGELDAAITELEAVLEDEDATGRRSNAIERSPGELSRRVASLAASRGDDELALHHLERARGDLVREAAPAHAVEETSSALFEVLFRLGRTEQAEDLAAQMLSRADDDRRPHWLVAAANVSTGDPRLERLREASDLAPHDLDVAEALEAELRARSAWPDLRAHLERRLELAGSPDERAAVLERLIASIVAAGEDPTSTSAKLPELYAELLALRPDHVDALLALATIRQNDGAEQEALMLWRRVSHLLATDDPRMLSPALRLGRRTLRDDLLEDAEHWFRRALALRPDDRDALAGLREVGHARHDPRAVLDAASGLLVHTEAREQRAQLEWECARAHIDLEEGHLAFERLKRAATEVDPRSALHLEIGETWLDLANRRRQRQEEALARAQLRRALGSDLPSESLHEEIRLLADELDARDEALELLELALVRHAASGTTIALLERLTSGDGGLERRLEVLRGVIDRLEDAGARDRVASLMLRSAREAKDATLALLALDRMTPGQADAPQNLAARRWAITSLGRVAEERAELEARLSDPGTPISQALITRFADCFEDAQDAAARLVELAAAAPADRGARLTEVAFALVERAADATSEAEGARVSPQLSAPIGLDALAILAPRGEIPRARWQLVEEAVFREGRPDRIARLSELAAAAHLAGVEHLAGRARELLERGLESNPTATSLHALVRARVQRDVGDQPRTLLEALRTRLDDVARRRGLDASARASLFISSANGLDDPLAIEHLAVRAGLERDIPEVFEPILAELERRHAWGPIVDLLEMGDADEVAADTWVSLALRSRSQSPEAEARARARAGLQLLAAGRTEAANEHLTRGVELNPRRTDLAHALGQALIELDRPTEALAVLRPLIEAGASSASGYDYAELCLQCGILAERLGQLEDAAELLVAARRHTPDRPQQRRTAAETLFGVLVALDRRREAARLAEATAEEHFTDPPAAARWLARATEMLGHGTDPREELRLLRRRLELDPADREVADQLERALEDASDDAGLIDLLRQRLRDQDLRSSLEDPNAPRLDATTVERARKLLALLDLHPVEDDDTRSLELRAQLWSVLAEYDEDPIPALLSLATLRDRQGRTEAANELRRRIVREAPEDPRAAPAIRALLDVATLSGDLETAAQMAHLALALGIRDADTYASARHLGKLTADPELVCKGARGLLDTPRTAPERGLGDVELAALWLDLASALNDLAKPTEALEALERGAAKAPQDAAIHREIIERWLALLETLDADAHATSEAKARAHLRRAMGDDLLRADRLAEIDLLLDRLGRVEPAISLVVEALARTPHDEELRTRLRRSCARSEATDRYPRALRDVIDHVDPGADRDELLMELARAARQIEGARTALRAVDELSQPAAGTNEMLDLRDWAVRKLGRVEDELGAIEQRLLTPPADALAVTRLWRTLESDAERTANRLLALAKTADQEEHPQVAAWLCMRAAEILADRAPHAHRAWIETIEAVAERADADDYEEEFAARIITELREAWTAASSQPDLDPELAATLAAIARRTTALGLDAQRARLLDEQLALDPEAAAIHVELLAGVEDDPGAAARWLSARSLDASQLDERMVGLAAVVEPDAGLALLVERWRARGLHDEGNLHDDPLVDPMFDAAARAEAYDRLERALTWAESQTSASRDLLVLWTRLAELAIDDPGGLERRARIQAARRAIEIGDDTQAIAALRRALELDDDEALRLALVERLEVSGDALAAADALEPLVQADPAWGQRAGELALAAGDADRAIVAWQGALPGLGPKARASLSRRLFSLLVDRGASVSAHALALAEADHEQARGETALAAAWLVDATALDARDAPDLLRRALALDPGRPGLAEAYEAALETAGRTDDLREALARALGGATDEGSIDPAQRDRRLRRWLELAADAPAPARRRALEVAARRWPDDVELGLELAQVRSETGDLEGALEVWTALAPQVQDGPAFFLPAMRLAEAAFERGDLETARQFWERALCSKPGDVEPWLRLRTLAARTDDNALIVRATEAILAGLGKDGDTPPTWTEALDPLELQRERSSGLERLGRPIEAARALEAACDLAPEGSEVQISICERWLALVSNYEGEATVAPAALAQMEARARAALRRAMGERLPSAALRAEAKLLALRLGAVDEALLLVRERVLASPDSTAPLEVLADLTDELGQTDERISYLAEVETLVDHADEGRDRIALIEHLAVAAKERGAPEVTLRAVSRLEDEQAQSPRMVELREWAIRRTGRIEEELARLSEQLVHADPGEALEQLAAQIFRLYEGDAEPWARRLLDAAKWRHRQATEADAGARWLALQVESHADNEGGISTSTRLEAVGLALELGAAASIHPTLESLFRQLRDEDRANALRAALEMLETHGFARPLDAGDERLERLSEALWAHVPDDPVAHRVMATRLGDAARFEARVEDYASTQSVDGAELGRLWIGASSLVEGERREFALRAAIDRVEDDPAARAALLSELERLGAWKQAVAGWLAQPQHATRDDLERLLDGTTEHPELQARIATTLAERVEASEPAFAADLFALAIDNTPPDAPTARELHRKLGLAMADTGRSEGALEHLLPLVEAGSGTKDDDESDPVLTLRVAELLLDVNAHGRATPLLERLWTTADDEGQRREIAARLWEVHNRDPEMEIDREIHARAYAHAAEDAEGSDRVMWLRRAADFAQPRPRVELLKRAAQLSPEDRTLGEELARALQAAGDRDELEALLRRRLDRELIARSAADDPKPATRRAVETARELLALLSDQDRYAESVALLEIILRLAPQDVEACSQLAMLRQEAGDQSGAEAAWHNLAHMLGEDDERFYDPAMSLADAAARRGDIDGALDMFERAARARPDDAAALRRRLDVAAKAERYEVVLAAAERLLDAGTQLERPASDSGAEGDPLDTAELERWRAVALDALGRPEAHAAWQRAVEAVAIDDPRRRVFCHAWIDSDVVRRDPVRGPSLEAEARACLRAAMLSDAPATLAIEAVESALGPEVDLLAGTLGASAEARDAIEDWLRVRPAEPSLLAMLKDISLAADGGTSYLAALDRGLTAASDPEARDELASELAYASVEMVDPQRLLDAVELLSPARAGSVEMLDLREWAVRQLGRVDDELETLERELVGDGPLAPTVTRLVRMLDGDAGKAAHRLFELARKNDGPRRAELLVHVLELSISGADTADLDLAMEALDFGVESVENFDPKASFEILERAAFDADDPVRVANLIATTRAGRVSEHAALRSRGQMLLARALTRYPDAASLHRVALGLPAASTDAAAAPTRIDEALLEAGVEELTEIAAQHSIRGRTAARMWTGLASLLERQRAADILSSRAQLALRDDPDAFEGLLDTLEDRKHWPEVLRLLEEREAAAEVPSQKVEALKQLAHVRADILGDQAMAIRHLERALEFAPRDPDLLLPLLDHHFGQRDLAPAIELSLRVLEHVSMGDLAYTALGHRAADAALARGEHERAEDLLARVLERVPDDERTQKRLTELRAVADDAEHRVRMLGAVASRQTGNARIDALEERARLLLTELDRPDEAISDLEAVIDEAPDRRESIQLLDELYIRRERWSELAELLERDYPRHAGLARARVLERIAKIYGDHLLDLARAERALRLALEQLGEVGPDSLEAQMANRLHLLMAKCLEQQGRFVELADMLEAELAAELLDEVPGPIAGPRLELMGHLARILRDFVEDEARAAAVYERLERLGELPEEGLATLARWYRAQNRHEDLVRVLIVRSKTLGREGDTERKAELDRRIGELLDGPLRRPHEAARYFLDAYLANPEDNHVAGARARVLLAGTDSVVNVRQAVLERLPDLDDTQRAYGLVLLAELLAPQDSFESEAEHRFEEALDIVPNLAPALDGLGRLRARQGRLEQAVDPLVRAVVGDGLDPDRAADTAAVAARALLELHRLGEAEQTLAHALNRNPNGQRALLELARLHSRTGRREDEAEVLDRLSEQPLSSMLRAEVAYRRAMLLEPEFSRDPFCEAGEEARAHLLEAVGADAMHAQARQVLLDLASARSEWSIVAHMYFLAVRELPPGPSRALTHLDLAEVYLDRLHDADSATRNLSAALSQPTSDLVVRSRANALAHKLPDPDKAAISLARNATEDQELDNDARARLLVTAAELHLRGNDPEAGERALSSARALPELSEASRSIVERAQDLMGTEDLELRKQRANLTRLLGEESHGVERLHIHSRLIEIGRALSDADLIEENSRALIELAHGMLGNPAERESAVLALRDLFAERGDFARLVALYEDLAEKTNDANQAADLLVDAARFAWSGVRDGKLAVVMLGRALRHQASHPLAIALLGDMATAEDVVTEQAMLDELSRLDPRSLDPRLALRLSAIALRLGRTEQARSVLDGLLQRPLPPPLQLEVLTQLDRLLQDRHEVDARLDLLERRLNLAREHAPDQVPSLALELANAQVAAGSFEAARRTCTRALEENPSNVALAIVYAELLERSEDWSTLARVLEHLASISIDPNDKAAWYTRAAQVHLDHDDAPAEAMASARRLLTRARETAPRFAEARSTMIPLSFAEQRWDEVLELSIELRTLGGDDDEALLFGAVTEALVHGRRTIARSIGPRHDATVRSKLLWPAVARVCEQIALHGPLPRLDAVLGACAALTGTTEDVHDELQAWTAGRPSRAGTALVLARINEAIGRAELGQLMYQLCAFLAPAGPVPGLVARLPEVRMHESDPLHDARCVPLAWRGALREILIGLRELLAGIRGQGGEETYPRNAIERSSVQTAGRLVSGLREPLAMTIPVRITDDPLHAGVGIRNRPEPMIVVSEELTYLPDPERAFRMAMAASAIASGLAMVTDTHAMGLGDLLDALARFADPEVQLDSSGARFIADALAARGLRAAEFDPEFRATLAAELRHWRQDDRTIGQLVTTIRRATMLLATRLCGRLDGALLTLARDQGVLVEGEHPEGKAVMSSADAQWLLRELGVTA